MLPVYIMRAPVNEQRDLLPTNPDLPHLSDKQDILEYPFAIFIQLELSLDLTSP